MAHVGEVIIAQTIKARWVYSELSSPRFGHLYAGPQHLIEARKAGTPFEQLPAPDQTLLASMLVGGRGEYFDSLVDMSQLYHLAELTRGQVGHLWALPTFGPPEKLPFMDFMLETYGAGNVAANADPRRTQTEAQLSRDHEPAIIVRLNHQHLLLDGYGRAVTLMRGKDPQQRLRAWCPLVTTINE